MSNDRLIANQQLLEEDLDQLSQLSAAKESSIIRKRESISTISEHDAQSKQLFQEAVAHATSLHRLSVTSGLSLAGLASDFKKLAQSQQTIEAFDEDSDDDEPEDNLENTQELDDEELEDDKFEDRSVFPLPPPPLSPYERQVAEAKKLIAEAAHISQIAHEIADRFQLYRGQIQEQFDQYISLIEANLTEEHQERLQKELMDIYTLDGFMANVHFEAVEKLSFFLENQLPRLGVIAQRLRELHYDIGKTHIAISGSTSPDDINGERQSIHDSLQLIKEAQNKISDQVDLALVKNLNAQKKRLIAWRDEEKASSSPTPMQSLHSLLHAKKLKAAEEKTLAAHYRDMGEFVRQQALPIASNFHFQIMRNQEKITTHIKQLNQLAQREADTEEQLTQLEADFTHEQKRFAEELPDLINAQQAFNAMEAALQIKVQTYADSLRNNF